MSNIRNIIYLFLFALLLSPSCASRKTATQPDRLDSRQLTIQRLSDKALLALATRNYIRFAAIIDSAESADVSSAKERYEQGLSAARKLLGPQAARIVLDRWDAQSIDVSFDDDFLWATSCIDVSVRLGPAHKPKNIVFNFRFHRRDNSSPWRLHIP
jgi:hypothetical protein